MVTDGGNTSVQVAVRIRPQSYRETAQLANICTIVTPDEPQITMGDKSFTFDFVFDQLARQQQLYDKCVKRLVEGTFQGFNATVLAYGQTGSGKTYTMGTNFDSAEFHDKAGMIPRAAHQFFDSIKEIKETAINEGKSPPSFELSIQFVELYNEEIIDLMTYDRSRQIKIREDPIKNEISLNGTICTQVNSADDILDSLRNGALNRKTAMTSMNEQSSRSHAIFTVVVNQKRFVSAENNDENIGSADIENISAKFHFVDLAGSERLKRTGATGDRAKEGININSGLLALGNVISALGCPTGRHTHVPYRDSKLTRILQDSLGGNSRTLMIACASPSDIDFVETLNTLNYANRAKNIKNKVVANQLRTNESRQNAELRARVKFLENEVLELSTELNEYRQGKRVCEKSAKMLLETFQEADEEINESGGSGTEIILHIKQQNSDINDVEAMDIDDDDDHSGEEETSEERDRLCGHLAKLEEDINVKERLVAELQRNDKRLAKMRQVYERKLNEMSERIQATETERDRILAEMNSKQQEGLHDKIRAVRDEYEKRIHALREEQRRLKDQSSENKRMLAQQERQKSELEKIQHELLEMKRSKVDLTKRLKEENRRIREIQTSTAKQVAGYEKNARKQENAMRKLQLNLEHKEQQLNRKNEEMQKLRVKQKDVDRRRRTLLPQQINSKLQEEETVSHSQSTATASSNAKPSVSSHSKTSKKMHQNISTPVHDIQNKTFTVTESIFSPLKVKRHWNTMESMVSRLITHQQAVTSMEQQMEKYLNEREKLQEELKELETESFESTDAQKQIVEEQKQSIGENLRYINEQIKTAQKTITEMDNIMTTNLDQEASDITEGTSKALTIDNVCQEVAKRCSNIVEAQYIIQKLVHLLVTKAVEYTKANTQITELEAHIKQFEEEKLDDSKLIPLISDDNDVIKIVQEGSNSPSLPGRLPPRTTGRAGLMPPVSSLLVSPTDEFLSSPTASTFTIAKQRRRTASTHDLLHSTCETFNIGTHEGTSHDMKTMIPIPEGSSCISPDVESQCSGNTGEHGSSEWLQQQKKQKLAPRSPDPSHFVHKIHSLEGHSKAPMRAYATETRLITGSRDRTAKIWDIEANKAIMTLNSHQNNVTFVHLLPNEQQALTSTLNIVKVWDLRSKLCTHHLSSMGIVSEGINEPMSRTVAQHVTEATIYGFCLDPSGTFLFTTCRNDIRVWDLNKLISIGKLSGNHDSNDELSCIAVSFDAGKKGRLISGSKKAGLIGLYDINLNNSIDGSEARGCPINYQQTHGHVTSLFCYDRSGYAAFRDGSLARFRIGENRVDQFIPNAHDKSISAICMLKPLRSEDSIREQFYKTPFPNWTKDEFPKDCEQKEIPPLSRLLTTVCRNGCLKFWDVTTYTNRMRILETVSHAHDKRINDVCTNSKRMFTTSEDLTIGVWKIKD